MTHINTPALNQLRSTNNLVTVTDAADTDIGFGYILKRPPADIDRLWQRVARMHKIVTGRIQPIQRLSLQMALLRSLDWMKY